MRQPTSRTMLVQLLLIVPLLVAACTPATNIEVGYQPPFLPIRIGISLQGVTVSWNESIQTPIGIFSAGISLDITSTFPGMENTLTVRVNGEDTVYDLRDAYVISVELEEGYYRQIRLQKNGNHWLFEAEQIYSSSEERFSSDPVNFVSEYWNNVSNRSYDAAWEKLSPDFQ